MNVIKDTEEQRADGAYVQSLLRGCIGMIAGGLLFALGVSWAAEGPAREKQQVAVSAISDGLHLHSLLQSNMVIQRDRPIRVQGWATPGVTVEVSFADQMLSATAGDDHSWHVLFPAMPASSDARRMVVKGDGKTIELVNILVGDVWVCGGQSNMEFPLSNAVDGDLEVASANFPEIRLLTVPKQAGPERKLVFPNVSGGHWAVCTPETARSMSAIGYIFARRIHMATRIPIGLIDASVGGTCIETWTPIETLHELGSPEVTAMLAEWDDKVFNYTPQQDLKDRVALLNSRTERLQREGRPRTSGRKPPTALRKNPYIHDGNRPGNYFAGMIEPLTGFAVKGAIWHQGYNNAMQKHGDVLYRQVFPRMIKAWRVAFGDPTMPFGIISLCTDAAPQDTDNYLGMMMDRGIYIREVQYKTFLDLYTTGDLNIGFASSFDYRRHWYHPQIKVPVGDRIARWALATQYGKSVAWKPPMLKRMSVEAGRIVLELDADAKPHNDGPILGFAIAGVDGRFQPAVAENKVLGKDGRGRPRVDRKTIFLSSPWVPNPVHFRYAWGRNPQANLKQRGIPFATQRSDTWSMAKTYEAYMGRQPATPGVLEREEVLALRSALQAEDELRRIAEAKRLIERAGGMADHDGL